MEVKCLKPHSQYVQEPGLVCGSGNVTHSPECFLSWPGCSASYIKESCLRFGWSMRPHWNSNYVIFQTPANDQMCGKRLSTCLTEAEMHAPTTAGTKTPARWAFNHTHPSTAPFYITTFVLRRTLLLVITHRGSYGYVPWRHCLKCQNPRQLESWCGEHSGVCPSQLGIAPLQRPFAEHSPFSEAQKHIGVVTND